MHATVRLVWSGTILWLTPCAPPCMYWIIVIFPLHQHLSQTPPHDAALRVLTQQALFVGSVHLVVVLYFPLVVNSSVRLVVQPLLRFPLILFCAHSFSPFLRCKGTTNFVGVQNGCTIYEFTMYEFMYDWDRFIHLRKGTPLYDDASRVVPYAILFCARVFFVGHRTPRRKNGTRVVAATLTRCLLHA